MIKIGPATPEITRVTNGLFWMTRQKSAYLAEYLTNYWTNVSASVDVRMRITKLRLRKFRGSPRDVAMVTN